MAPSELREALRKKEYPPLEVRRYENGKGAWVDVLDVQMPGYPNYDGGATGVSIKWGRHRQFVIARDVAHFWSQWPYSVCAPC